MGEKTLPLYPDYHELHLDAGLDVLLRRKLVGLAVDPFDPYVTALSDARETVGLGPDDLIVEIGAHTGQYILEAAAETDTPSWIAAIDPLLWPYKLILPLCKLDTRRLTFIRGTGEDIMLPDKSARVATLMNVIFRARNPLGMLLETHRVLEDDGAAYLGTNGKNHSPVRHGDEEDVAGPVREAFGLPDEPIYPPAHGCYAEQVEELAARAGFRVVRTFSQSCRLPIGRSDLPLYTDTLKLGGALLSDKLPVDGDVAHMRAKDAAMRRFWRRVVDAKKVPELEERLRKQEEINRARGIDAEPHFDDWADRRVFKLQKK